MSAKLLVIKRLAQLYPEWLIERRASRLSRLEADLYPDAPITSWSIDRPIPNNYEQALADIRMSSGKASVPEYIRQKLRREYNSESTVEGTLKAFKQVIKGMTLPKT